MNGITTKFIAALAVFAMVFAGVGAAIAADNNDATIITADGIKVTYANDEDGLYAVITANINTGVVTSDKTPITILTEFCNEVWAFDKDADVTFTIPYTLASGKVLADYVPASLIDLYGPTAVEVTAKYNASPAVAMDEVKRVLETAVNGILSYDTTKASVEIDILLAKDVYAYTAEEMAAIVAEAISVFDDYLSPEEVEQAVNAAKQAVIDTYKDYKSPEEVQKAIDEAVAKVKGGDATIAWCVAAVGIIAALVLAGFVLVVFNKANKEGRRLL